VSETGVPGTRFGGDGVEKREPAAVIPSVAKDLMPQKNANRVVQRRQPRLEVGDRVRIIDISADLKDPGYDSKHDECREMRTGELFRFCVGRVFTVYGFDRYGNVELHAGNSSAVRKKFGKWHSIWSEPKFLKLVRKRKVQRKKLRKMKLSS
jgi:hypothetical protein